MDFKKTPKLSKTQKMLGGVCGGLAEWAGIDATLMRLIFIFIALFPIHFHALILYLICWVVMDKADA